MEAERHGIASAAEAPLLLQLLRTSRWPIDEVAYPMGPSRMAGA